MANRANRSLLFGAGGAAAGAGGAAAGAGGATSAAAAADAEALTADNDRGIDALQGRSGAIKAVRLAAARPAGACAPVRRWGWSSADGSAVPRGVGASARLLAACVVF